MIDKLFASFRKDEAPADPEASMHAAVAALLIEAARADEDYTEEERAMIDRMLARRFGLEAGAARALRERAEADQEAANDLYGFTKHLKDGLDREGKLSLIEDLWRIVLSDEARDPHEEMVVRRVVGLLHMEDTDSTAARQRAERG